MAYSFTEKKRIRKNFGKRPASSRCRTCWPSSSIPTASSCRPTSAEDSARSSGLHAAFKTVFPITSYSGNATLEYVELPARRAAVRRGVPAAWPDLRRAAARQGAPGRLDKEAAGAKKPIKDVQRAGGLPGRAAAHDRQRHLRHQRHRARHRLAAAPLAGRVLRPRPRQDATARASCCSRPASFPTAARGSTSSSTRRTACSRASTAAASCR